MSYFPPDPGKRQRVFYMSRKQRGYVLLPQRIADDLPPEWFWRDEAIEMLPLKRMDMTDAQIAALPQIK